MNFAGDGWTAGLIATCYHVLVILTIVILVFRKRETASIYGWTLAILFLPVVGIVLFYLLGWRRQSKRLKRKVLHRSDFPLRFPVESQFHRDPDRIAAPLNDPWERIHHLGERLGAGPLRQGNEVDLLSSGEATFSAIFEAIEKATHHVHIEKYIFRRDPLGIRLLDLLIRKAREGVEVRLLVDAVGSFGIWRMIRALKRAGGQGAIFLPLLPFPKNLTPNLRNHRKIVVCDGRIGFMGGINVGEEYLGKGRQHLEWCDAHLLLKGPAVLDLQRIFIEDWDFATGRLLTEDAYIPATPPQGSTPIQIVPSGPDQDSNAARQVFLAAINQSREEILLASPYVVPDQVLRESLINAALRGVHVALLTQRSPPDHWLPYFSSRYYWKDLLEAGIEIFRFQPGMMHAKVVVVDGAWASVGSANFDTRSLGLNFEVTGITRCPSLVKQVRERFNQNLRRSRSTALKTFQERPWPHRALEGFAHLFAPLL